MDESYFKTNIFLILSDHWNPLIVKVFQPPQVQCDILIELLSLWRNINNNILKENRAELFSHFLNPTYIKYLFDDGFEMAELPFKIYLDIIMHILSSNESKSDYLEETLAFSTAGLSQLPLGVGESGFCGSISKGDDSMLEHRCDPVTLTKVTYVLLKLMCCMTNEDEILSSFSTIECFVKDKSDLPYHLEAHSWIIQLFLDHDDLLIGAISSTLQLYLKLQSCTKKIENFKKYIDPNKVFLKLVSKLGHDHHILMDFLMNETAMLPYLLEYLKFVVNDWPLFLESHADFNTSPHLSKVTTNPLSLVAYSSSSSSSENENISAHATINLFIKLRLGIEKLLEHNEFPYNAKPLIDLLKTCESKNLS